MQIVIELADEIYEMKRPGIIEENINEIISAVIFGKPLPKGHGRLIDADKIEYLDGAFLDKNGEVLPLMYKIASIDMIKYCCPTIIEADKEVQDG